jgi:hypothetical protein
MLMRARRQISMSEMELDVGPGRSYRFYTGPTVFPFGACPAPLTYNLRRPHVPSPHSPGFGLSLTTFTLTASGFPPPPTFAAEAAPSAFFNYTVTVTNTGAVPGDEVVQVGG